MIRKTIMYSLLMFLVLCCPAGCDNKTVVCHTSKSECCCHEKCNCKNCNCENCHCKDCKCKDCKCKKCDNPKCDCGKNCDCVKCDCNVGNKKILRVSDIIVRIKPENDSINIEVESSKVLPAYVTYHKNDRGGYSVTLVVKDRSVVMKPTCCKKENKSK